MNSIVYINVDTTIWIIIQYFEFFEYHRIDIQWTCIFAGKYPNQKDFEWSGSDSNRAQPECPSADANEAIYGSLSRIDAKRSCQWCFRFVAKDFESYFKDVLDIWSQSLIQTSTKKSTVVLIVPRGNSRHIWTVNKYPIIEQLDFIFYCRVAIRTQSRWLFGRKITPSSRMST